MTIKVVDIFAGPGGLGEGFTSLRDAKGNAGYDVVLSVEKEAFAFQTLLLRAFFRLFDGSPPLCYYQALRGELDVSRLYERFPAEAREAEEKCWHAALGPSGASLDAVRKRVRGRVRSGEPWVLIGGPPCQAYSLVGRARNRGNPSYDPATDERQRLYVEYLQILADHAPPVFVMENVKGLLSASINEEALFSLILSDLRNPGAALRRQGRFAGRGRPAEYRIFSLASATELTEANLRDSVVRAEDYGVPQARHRVILLGVRTDLDGALPRALRSSAPVPAEMVLDDLPELRSGLSRCADSPEQWMRILRAASSSRWANAGAQKAGGASVSKRIRQVLRRIEAPQHDRGAEYFAADYRSSYRPRWFSDGRIHGIVNHSSRSHMAADLFRYLYSAVFAEVHGRSPSLREFPTDLIPSHSSAPDAIRNGGYFSDRFRVQIKGRPSTTVVSHISKDGHYYIHPDPTQCRSLTVREAARLQTFPDNYLFLGPRTAQYVQVGNAVPPLLARQIAAVVYELLGGTPHG